MAEFSMEMLVHPPFENDPPLKMNVPAKTLGLILAIVYLIFAILSLIGIPLALGIGVLVAAGGGGHITLLIIAGAVIALVGNVLVALGGFRMNGLKPEGKTSVIYGLFTGVIASVVGAIGFESANGIVGSIIVAAIVYYFVIISRFPSEAPLVAARGTGAPPPPVG
jgi:hypothetical protein